MGVDKAMGVYVSAIKDHQFQQTVSELTPELEQDFWPLASPLTCEGTARADVTQGSIGAIGPNGAAGKDTIRLLTIENL